MDRAADSEILNSKLAIIEALEAENRSLRAQLAAISSRSGTANSSATIENETTAGTPAPTPSNASTKPENAELIKFKMRFNALSDNFKKAKEHLRKRKDDRDWWAERAKTLERQARAAEEKHGIRILEVPEAEKPAEERSNRLVSDTPNSGLDMLLPPTVQTPPSSNRNANVEDAQLQSTQGDPDEPETQALPPLSANDDQQAPIFIKPEPSSDLPVVVSARTLKRRRVEDDGYAAATTPRIKTEPNDSSPVAASEHYQFDIQESLDLDDIAQRITTPRKRKDVEVSAAEYEDEAWRTAPHTALKPGRVRTDGPQQSASNIRAASVLTPISGNKRITKQVVDKEDMGTVKAGLAYAISVLAEDGTPYGTKKLDHASKAMNTPVSTAKGRLDTLLNSPTADNLSTISRSGRASAEDTPLGLTFPEPRELPFDKILRQAKKGPHHLGADASTPSKKPEKKAPVRDKSPHKGSKRSASGLRHKPLSELRLDDFKVNPLSNEGQDFAYSEVVRDKDDRAALRGCTDMHCCGKHFRALALSQRPTPPLTAAQQQEEQKLLEDYLGDYAYRLSSMTKNERDQTWIEAKTQELANKYGKHRHRFSRMQSPPGFWNADFPTTQELAADREEALRREKRAIAERHREALRPGGMWLFRDE